MTSRERIEAALRHSEPDRTPIFEYVLLSPLADVLLGRSYAGDPSNWFAVMQEKGWKNAVRQNAIDRLDIAEMLGHDMMYVPPLPSTSALEYECADADSHCADNPVEALKKRNEIAARLPAISEQMLEIYVCLKEEMHQRDIDLPILAPAYFHGVWTDIDLMQTMLLAPYVARSHFSIATKRALTLITQYKAIGVDQIGVGGDFSGTRPLISPEAYREFIVPEVRKLSRHIHEVNLHAVNASDGNLWPVIDDFLLTCEVDGYLEIDLHAGMDIAKLKAAYGGRITLYGNLDCGNILSFGTLEEVREHTIACLEAGLGNGGHVLCAGNAITASVPLENYLAVVNTYKDMFFLPRFEVGQ